MASAKFLEEALSTDVDETAVSALVGSLENQLVTNSSTVLSQPSSSYVSVNQNHVNNSAISNGGTLVTQKHIANGSSDGMNNIVLHSSADLSQKNIPQGVVTIGKPINQVIGGAPHPAMVGNSSTILPAGNVQLINVNALRQGTPPQQPGQKAPAPRLIIPQQLVGGRPTQNLTLQALQGLQGGQGHLLLKTENGQYQLLKVGPPPPGSTISGTTTIPANNAAFRLQTIPGQGTVTNSVPPALTPTSVPAAPQTMIQQQQTQPQQQTHVVTSTPPQQQQPQQAQAPRGNLDTVKEKCRKFLSNLLELSSREPKAVERNVRTLIQELVDAKKSLPLLRQSMVTKELSIDGIRPPPPNLVFTQQQQQQPTPSQQQQQPPPQQMQTTIIRQPNIIPPPLSQPMRIITPSPIVSSNSNLNVVRNIIPSSSPSPQQIPQQRLITPVRGKAAQQLQQQQQIQGSNPPSGPVINNTAPSPRLVSPRPPRTPLLKNTPSVPVTPNNKAANSSTMQTLAHRLTAPKGAAAKAAAATTPVVSAPQATVSSPAVGSPTPKGRGGAGARSQNSQSVSAANSLNSSSGVASTMSAGPTRTFTSKDTKKSSASTFSSPSSSSFVGDDDINDVAAMGGVNLAEETQRILGSTEMIGTQIRSCKDEIFLHSQPLLAKISLIAAQYNLDEPSSEIVSLVSHATQSRLSSLTEKLSICAEHRSDQQYKALPGYSLQADARGQLKFLESLDRIEARRREEQEREMLLRAAKSRSKSEDPEQVKLKAKAKEMQRAEMEELRQKAADLTALQAIGPRKKPKLENADGPSQTSNGLNSNSILSSRPQLPLKPRVKRITMKDCIFLLEREREYCKSELLYKAYLK
ncbi:hypothetical protein M8J76_011724 [Diaphorina citri]|nr:hypothetical protein M8J76_011724 [Diaphorina citri]